MPSLPTLSEKQRDLKREVEELIASGAERDEIEAALEEKLSLEENAEEKLEGYYHILREMKEHESACQSEIEVLRESKDRTQKAREALEQNVKFYMESVAHEDELYAGPAHFRVNKVGGRRAMNTPGRRSEYPQSTKKWKVTIDIDGAELTDEQLEDLLSHLRRLSGKSGVSVKERERILKSRVREQFDESSDLVEYEERGTKLKYD